MKVCLISSSAAGYEDIARACRRRAELLGSRHEVTLVDAGADPGELAGVAFACDPHRHSAVAMAAIEREYGPDLPDYVESPDRGALGLTALMARRAGHALLERATFGVRLYGTEELHDLHEGLSVEQTVHDLEREQFRLADCVVWTGGEVLDAYRRLYPSLPTDSVRIGDQPACPQGPSPGGPAERDGPLRLLYAGELRRGLGALELAEACLRLPGEEWELTMVGADTRTAPAGQSVRATIEAMFRGDPRLTIAEPPAEGRRAGLWAEHDVLVAPFRFAVGPEIVLEAMRAGVPVLATPVGDLPEIVVPGASGRLAADRGATALGEALQRLLDEREELRRLRASGRVFEQLRELADGSAILDGYERLFERLRGPGVPEPGRPSPAREPLVTGVVPYYRGAAHVEEAVGSLLGQTHGEIEVLIVNDGSFEPEDAVLERLAEDPRVQVLTTLNSGEASARNLGARVARGKYVVMLDADNALEPEFVARALSVYEREPELAYVSCWLRFVDAGGAPFTDPAGYAPLGNRVLRDDRENWDGDTLALLPRSIFERGYGFDREAVIYSDWELYRRLRRDGLFGAVIPERLARYRVLPGSLQRGHSPEMRHRGWEEARARRVASAIGPAAGGGDG